MQAKTFSPCKFHLKVQQSQNISHDTLARKKIISGVANGKRVIGNCSDFSTEMRRQNWILLFYISANESLLIKIIQIIVMVTKKEH